MKNITEGIFGIGVSLSFIIRPAVNMNQLYQQIYPLGIRKWEN